MSNTLYKSKTGSSLRTRHRDEEGNPKYTNRLFRETSPYLLQHAHNPVDWYAWGEEAVQKAKRLNRPLLVSIGYSTCHWCHVMEEESFEDEEIAGFMNDHFICVKVDREERPDVDAIYMGAVQLLTGQGGWPLNVVLTPSLKPFFGGTYFPARDGDRGTVNGFLTILTKIAEAWKTQPETVVRSSEEISRHIEKMLSPEPGKAIPSKSLFDEAALFFKKVYDPVHGGMKGAPKFPATFHVRFLVKAASMLDDPELERMALHTLTSMARGGIYDHMGGGFHRYATDREWLVPHFEKMLYDNALLVPAYLEGYSITGQGQYETVAREVLDYVIRDMRSPEGGFYSATDADSPTPAGEKLEGYHFTWSTQDLEQALDPDKLSLAAAYFSMDGAPCFEGRHIPHITDRSLEKAHEMGFSPGDIRDIKEKLLKARDVRERPSTDTKILASWNGLMISALARAGSALNRADYLKVADDTARFICERLMENGRLKRAYTAGQARFNAYLDDYAFVTAAFLDLYDAAGDIKWLHRARDLDRVLETFYEDRNSGGFYMTSSDHEALIAREKPCHDGALPSGNSVAALNLLRFYGHTRDAAYLQRAEKTFKGFSGVMNQSPGACGEFLVALECYYRTKENP